MARKTLAQLSEQELDAEVQAIESLSEENQGYTQLRRLSNLYGEKEKRNKEKLLELYKELLKTYKQ